MERDYQLEPIELTEDELAAASGGYAGYFFNDVMVSSVVAGGGVAGGGGTGSAGQVVGFCKIEFKNVLG